MVLKDGAAVVQIAGTMGNKPPAMDVGEMGMVEVVTTLGETACCTDGIVVSAATEVASGKSSAAAGASRLALTDWGWTHRLRCEISDAAAIPPTCRIFCRSKRNLPPSNCRRRVVEMQRLMQPTARERRPPQQGGPSVTGKAFWHDHTERIRPDTLQT